MKTRNESLPFESFLKAYIIKTDLSSDSTMSEQEQDLAFSEPVDEKTALSVDKVTVLIRDVAKVLSRETLGMVISGALTGRTLEENLLQQQTGLTHSMVEAISQDTVYTNSVPIKSLVKLLKMLGVTIDRALAAIDATFDKLLTESKLSQAMPAFVQPSFRKGMKRGDGANDFPHSNMDESYLYQNKEALDKYTHRLVELYQSM